MRRASFLFNTLSMFPFTYTLAGLRRHGKESWCLLGIGIPLQKSKQFSYQTASFNLKMQNIYTLEFDNLRFSFTKDYKDKIENNILLGSPQ